MVKIHSFYGENICSAAVAAVWNSLSRSLRLSRLHHTKVIQEKEDIHTFIREARNPVPLISVIEAIRIYGCCSFKYHLGSMVYYPKKYVPNPLVTSGPFLSMALHGVPWTFMDLHGFPGPSMAITGPKWWFMVFHGPPLPFMALTCPHWCSMALHDVPWPTKVFHGTPWPSLTLHDVSWPSMVFHGALWPYMVF